MKLQEGSTAVEYPVKFDTGLILWASNTPIVSYE
jgi:hypothetical protein